MVRRQAGTKRATPSFAEHNGGNEGGAINCGAHPLALELKVYNADAASFNVNAVLVSGTTDAVLVGTGFTRVDAYRIAAMVLDSKTKLTTIYISQADPDFYFGAEVLKQVFADATLIASAATVIKIEATLAAWGAAHGRQRAD